MTIPGGCHCGAIEIRYSTSIDPSRADIRACQCTFCRKHNARAVSDPNGEALFIVHDRPSLRRYAFALRTAEFLTCGRCGVYLGAIMTDDHGAYATLNINAFADPGRFTQPPRPVAFDAETESTRRSRRRDHWTPARIEFRGR
ncbi:MAG: hypothetical protein GY791_02275 [Alphaproteobacteria bacterium]|nr:hypothetical protein [Alphaproteobacteria bacterium]